MSPSALCNNGIGVAVARGPCSRLMACGRKGCCTGGGLGGGGGAGRGHCILQSPVNGVTGTVVKPSSFGSQVALACRVCVRARVPRVPRAVRSRWPVARVCARAFPVCHVQSGRVGLSRVMPLCGRLRLCNSRPCPAAGMNRAMPPSPGPPRHGGPQQLSLVPLSFGVVNGGGWGGGHVPRSSSARPTATGVLDRHSVLMCCSWATTWSR